MKSAGLIAIAMTVLAVPLSAQGTKLSEFTLGAGVAVPFGKLADIAGPGPTFSATVTFPIGPLPTAIRLHAAYSVFGFADRSAPVAPTTISGGRQNPAYVELTAGIQFESLSERPIMPFAHVAWGFFFGEGSVPSNVTGGDHNTMHPGGSVGGGIKFRAASRLLSIDARYATMAGGDKYLPVTLGITF